MIGRNDPCWCGSGKKWKKCHAPELPHSPQEILQGHYLKSYGILLKNPKQINGIRQSGHLAASILDKVCAAAVEGVTTNELNTLAEKLHKEAGATAAPLGYGSPPFPKSICTSLNEVICHGIPNDIPLKNGDIINVDVTCVLNGYYGDCSRTVAIGEISEEKQRVTNVSLECLKRATAILKPGVFVYEIGEVIEDYATKHNCSVVNQFVGHGVGTGFHEPPQIPHHYNKVAIPLVEGMTFTIEPMINIGVRSAVIDPIDKWTARTGDKKPSAQWEYTILITQNGHEILTPWTL
jgi:methionyl aminopeptidase